MESIVLSFICQVVKLALSFIKIDKTLILYGTIKKTAGIIFKGCDLFSNICEREHSEDNS